MVAPVLAQHTVALDVRSASVVLDEATGQPVLTISLSPDGAKSFSAFTIGHVEEVVDILVSGKVVTSPRLNAPIYSDQIIVTGPFTSSELEAMADEINRGIADVTMRGEKNKSSN